MKAFLYIVVVAPLLMLLSLAVPSVFAQEVAKKPDIRLVIDVSGSMKRNDPQDLRRPAVDLLVRLMPEGGKAGVWTFGKYVNMLVPHQQVDAKWRDLARSKISDINSVALFTNIGEALEKAAYDAALPDNEKYATSIILLTDGMVDISKDRSDNSAEWRRIVDEVLPVLKGANYTIHTVALSDQADTELMERLAVATDGTASVAHSADDLLKIFLGAFNVAAPAQELPLENNSFAVDSSIDEFTALVFRKNVDQQTQLISPDEQKSTAQSPGEGVKWHRAERYDLITVRRPFEGEWKIVADLDPASRITIVSDLSLRVKKLPNNVFRGADETLSFLLQEEGNTITNAEFLALLDTRASVSYGTTEDQLQPVWRHSFNDAPPPDGGIFSVPMPALDKLGIYELALIVDGKTFSRQFSHRMVVREPFTASLSESTDDTFGTRQLLSVFSHSDLIDPSKTQIAATITKPDKRVLVKPLGLSDRAKWQTLLHMDQAGDYRISVQVAGIDNNKEPFEHTLEPIVMSYAPDAAFESPQPEPEPVVEPEPKPEPAAEVAPPPKPKPAELPVDAPAKGNSPWLLYAMLGGGNLIILGGGYLLFRKLMGGNDEVLNIDEDAQPDVESEDALPTIGDGSLEEEPPMDDLNSMDAEDLLKPGGVDDSTIDESGLDDLDDEPSSAAGDIAGETDDIPELVDKVEDEPDDLERILAEHAADASEDEQTDFAEDILKAQGLDLAEDELDDAISSLIDELDGSDTADDDVLDDDEYK